LQIQINMKTI